MFCFLSANSTAGVVGDRQDLGDLALRDRVKILKFGWVWLGGLFGIEQKCEVAGFERCSLGFAIVVTFLFVENFESVLNSASVLLVDSARQCRRVCFCAARLVGIGNV